MAHIHDAGHSPYVPFKPDHPSKSHLVSLQAPARFYLHLSWVWPGGSRHLPILAWLSMFLAWTTAYLTVSRISEVIHQLHPMGWNCPRCSILIYSSTKQQHAGQEWRKAQALLAWLPMNKFTRPQETRKTIRESKGFKMISGSFANMYKTTVVFLKESPLLSILSKSSLFFRSNKVNYSSPWASW